MAGIEGSPPVPFLTADERDRFAAWLEAEARSDTQMAEQCDKIHQPQMAKVLRDYAIAAAMIARKLREIEEVFI